MDICCVCYNSDINLLEINQITPNNDLSIKTLLELLVPEVIWLKHYLICSKCLDDLNVIPKLRQQCLESQRIREMEIKAEEPNITEYASDQSFTEPLNVDIKFKSDDPRTESAIPFSMQQEEEEEEVPEVPSNSILTRTTLILNEPSIENKYACIHCGKAFNKKPELDVHEMIHLNKQQYNCGTCRKCFDSSLSLHFHNMAEHTDPIYWRYQCQSCYKRFPMKEKYDIHIESHHQNNKNFKEYKCDLCSREYSVKRSLDTHKYREHRINNFKVQPKET